MAVYSDPNSQAPQGISYAPPAMQEGVEALPDGTFSVDMGEGENELPATPILHNANLADVIEDNTLVKIGNKVLEDYEIDKQSCADWWGTIEKGIRLLGLKLNETTQPFEGACTAVHPLMIENAVKYQSKIIQEIYPASGPVKTKILGTENDVKVAKANRIREFMNYQLSEQMPEYYDDTEGLLFYRALVGHAIRKIWYDPVEARPCADFLPMDRFVISYDAPDLRRASRYSEVIFMSKNDYRKAVQAGRFREIPLGEPVQEPKSDVARKIDEVMGMSPGSNSVGYTFVEQTVDLPIDDNAQYDEDAIAYSHRVTVDIVTQKVVAIYRNWEQTDPLKRKILWYSDGRYVKGFGYHGLGLLHFLGNITMAATAAMRALVDAGQFSNLPAGFKSRGIRYEGGNTPLAPGEWRDVEATGMDLSKSLVPLPYKGADATLLQMLQYLVDAGQKFADSTEQVVADSTNYGPVGTTLALLDASTKFFSALHKRAHKAMRDELRILKKINGWYSPKEYPYDVEGAQRVVYQSDFDGSVDVLPVSDPNIPSQSHRLALAQLQLQLATQAPDLHDRREAFRRIYVAAGIQEVDKILPQPQQAQQSDPLTDVQNVIRGLPIKAFPGQDHDAHIAVKTAWLQDPLNGANQVMQQAAPLVMSNVRDHMVAKWVEQIGGMLQQQGITGQNAEQMMQQGIMEKAMSEAASQVLEANKNSMGDMDVEKAMLMLNMAELELRKRTQGHKERSDAAQSAIRLAELEQKGQSEKVKAIQAGVKTGLDAKNAEKDRGVKLAETATKLLVAKVQASRPKTSS